MKNIIKGMLVMIGVITVIIILQYFTGTLDSNTVNYIKGMIIGMIIAHYSE